MPEHSERILKIICAALGLYFVLQLARIATVKDPLADVNLASLNAAKAKLAEKPATNEVKAAIPPVPPPSAGPPGARPPRPGSRAADLPAGVQSRVEQIKESEILGTVQRPLPMALLGIAGKDVFLRTASGQTGLVREGDELGGVKLLQVGTNRVLIELEGQQKELTLFEGFGSESLLQPGKETKQ